MFRLASIAAVLVLLTCLKAAQRKGAGDNVSLGEVIVKFSDKSKPAEFSAHAIADSNPHDTKLNSYIQSISAEMGIPLEVTRLGSGGNVILRIRESEIVTSIVNRLREDRNVQDVQIIPENDSAAPSVEVTFKDDTPEARVLIRASREGAEPNSDVQAIAERVQGSDMGLLPRVTPPGRLVLAIDRRRLTLAVVRQLSQRPDVEYAQPNFFRRPIEAGNNVQSPK